ncbi:MAG: nucleoside hydrolase [Promethearchaeota archaeon]
MIEQRVLVDTDPGLGLKYTDVDDGLALFLMLNNPIFKIEGITTIFGNTPVYKGFLLVKKYLKLFHKMEIPNFRGAASRSELGKLNKASKFLIEKVKEHPNDLTLLTLGPFTNIATALMNYSEFFHNLKQIIIMGGTLSPLTMFNQRFKCIDRRFFDKIKIQSLVAEFNSLKDPRATKKVLEAKTKTPRIQMGLEICCKTVITDKEINRIAQVKKDIPQFIAKHVQFWLRLWKGFNGKKGFFPFDTCVPIYLLAPELYKSINIHLSVDTQKVPGKYSILKSTRPDSAPITYCTNFKNSSAKKDFIEILISNLIR